MIVFARRLTRGLHGGALSATGQHGGPFTSVGLRWCVGVAAGLMSLVALTGCDSTDPIDVAAQAICDAIDDEPSDEAAFEGFERDIARERRAGMDEDELRRAVDARCGRAVSVISQPHGDEDVAEEEPEEEPEEDADPVPVDLPEVDWTKQEWATDCTQSGEPESLTLTEANEPGELWHHPDPSDEAAAPVYTVEAESALYGDVTGDGLDDAVFPVNCFLGNDFTFSVEVWSHDEDGQPWLLPTVVTFTKWDGLIDDIDAQSGAVRVHTSEPAPGDDAPHLNGYPVEVVTDWHFADGAWLSEKVSRTDTTPDPEPEPTEAEPSPQVTEQGHVIWPEVRDAPSEMHMWDAWSMTSQADQQRLCSLYDTDPNRLFDDVSVLLSWQLIRNDAEGFFDQVCG